MQFTHFKMLDNFRGEISLLPISSHHQESHDQSLSIWRTFKGDRNRNLFVNPRVLTYWFLHTFIQFRKDFE